MDTQKKISELEAPETSADRLPDIRSSTQGGLLNAHFDSPVASPQRNVSQKMIKQFEAYKDKAKSKIDYFIACIDNALLELSSEQKSMTACIRTLSKIRNAGAGKSNGGIILLDQYFKVPQIGEVIRDIWVL